MVGKMNNVNSRAAWYLQACRYDTSYHRIPWYFFQKLPPVGWKESSTTTMYIFLSRKNARKKDRIYKFDTILFFQLFSVELTDVGRSITVSITIFVIFIRDTIAIVICVVGVGGTIIVIISVIFYTNKAVISTVIYT